MCLIVHHNYAGPRSGTFFKVLRQDNGQLFSPMQRTTYRSRKSEEFRV